MAKTPREFQGGRVNSGRREEAYPAKPRRGARLEPMPMDAAEKALADALEMIASRYHTLSEGTDGVRAVFRISGSEPDERDERVAKLQRALAEAGVAVEGMTVQDRSERPYEDAKRFTTTFRFNPEQMLAFLESERVTKFMDRIVEHVKKESEKAPASYTLQLTGIVPLRVYGRSELSAIADDCRELTGRPRLVKKLAPDKRAEETMKHHIRDLVRVFSSETTENGTLYRRTVARKSIIMGLKIGNLDTFYSELGLNAPSPDALIAEKNAAYGEAVNKFLAEGSDDMFKKYSAHFAMLSEANPQKAEAFREALRSGQAEITITLTEGERARALASVATGRTPNKPTE